MATANHSPTSRIHHPNNKGPKENDSDHKRSRRDRHVRYTKNNQPADSRGRIPARTKLWLQKQETSHARYFKYRCQYCGKTKRIMTVDHVIPKAKGGTDAWSNLTCACKTCNDNKGDRTPEEANMPNPETVRLDTSFLKFCALTQSGKTRLIEEQRQLTPTQTVYGWQTKQNRETAGLPKTHYYDALCTRDVTKKPIRLTDTVHEIRLRRRNTRRTHIPSPKKGGGRQPYNENRSLEDTEKET